jgi:hypothetical protein
MKLSGITADTGFSSVLSATSNGQWI